MQATLDAFALKPFTKALTCLSKYGDDLAIYATPDTFSLSATNSSMSAYCRFKYSRQFFSKYSVGAHQPDARSSAEGVEDVLTVTGQLLTKSLLSILKHRTVEKTVERCELSIAEGGQTAGQDPLDEDEDGLESKLIVRLHCKHGVVKTHRLLLLIPTSLMAPGVPDAPNESRLMIGPRAIKDMIEHFPLARGAKSDPQLVWNFGDSEVDVKSLESSVDTKGNTQLSTELTISAEEFDIYDIYSPPTTIAFHLREFNATIAFSESMSLPLDIRFTDPAAPLFIDIEGDSSETLFVISTSQVHGAAAGASSNQARQPQLNDKKRQRDDNTSETARIKKPMRAVQRADPVSVARADLGSRSQSRVPGPMALPSVSRPPSSQTFSQDVRNGTMAHPSFIPLANPSFSHTQHSREPLFLPGSSQLSVADEEAIRASGLGIESMDAEELEAMLEGEGEEVAFDFASQRSANADYKMPDRGRRDGDSFGTGTMYKEGPDDPDSFELLVDETELAPTQSQNSAVQSKTFRPLFED